MVAGRLTATFGYQGGLGITGATLVSKEAAVEVSPPIGGNNEYFFVFQIAQSSFRGIDVSRHYCHACNACRGGCHSLTVISLIHLFAPPAWYWVPPKDYSEQGLSYPPHSLLRPLQHRTHAHSVA